MSGCTIRKAEYDSIFKIIPSCARFRENCENRCLVVCLCFAAKCWRCFTNTLMTSRHYAFSRQHRTQFSEDVYAFVLGHFVAVQIWRVKELFVPGIVASTIKSVRKAYKRPNGLISSTVQEYLAMSFFKVALAISYSVKKLMPWIFISINIPKFCRSVKLHHLSKPGTIGKRYWEIIKYTFVMHTKVAASNARMEMRRVHWWRT